MPTHFQHFGSQLKARLLHRRIRTLSRRDWSARHEKVFACNPNYRQACPDAIEVAHLNLWRQLRPTVSIDTLRVCHGISGIAKPETVPEEVYVSEIEPCLNRYREISYLANKNFYNRWFTKGLFPQTFLHNIDGAYYDGEYRPLNSQGLADLLCSLSFPLVIKPSLGPGGGRGVYFPCDRKTLEEHMDGQANFVARN